MHRQDWSVVAFIQDGAIYIVLLNTPHQPSGLNAVDINKVFHHQPAIPTSSKMSKGSRNWKLTEIPLLVAFLIIATYILG